MQQADRYHEALSMQRHYDSLSQAAITAMAAVVGGTPVLYKSLGFPISGGVFFAAIGLLYIAMKVYESCDIHAAYALRVAALIEASNDISVKPVVNGVTLHGPAHAFSKREEYGLPTEPGGRIHSKITKFFWGATFIFIILGCTSLYVDLTAESKKSTISVVLDNIPEPGK